MSSKLDALWAYQNAEQEKSNMETALRSTPERVQLSKLHKLLKNQQATITKLTENLEAREQQIAHLNDLVTATEHRIEVETEELQEIVADSESTGEEYTELRHDVERLGKDLASLMQEIRKLYNEIHSASQSYHETRQIAGKAKKEYDAVKAECLKQQEDCAGEMEAVNQKIDTIRKSVDPVLLARYEKVKQHHPDAIAKVIDNKCSGCKMSLPMVMIKQLSVPGTVKECENCGRILYIEDN
jgi:predicted  nucleic acid-binding Zn-ribbon protein